jgi:3-deoxy-D-manno-octulosonic-acid transferase
MADETPFVDHEGLDHAETQVRDVLAKLHAEYRQEAEPWLKRLEQIHALRVPKIMIDARLAEAFQLHAKPEER